MRHDETTLNKLTRPAVEGILLRERLFQRLDARSSPVMWVNAPAGSGKTALVAGYLDSRQFTCLWYQVDQGDTDIATFFYYMGSAAKKAVPRKRKPLPLLTSAHLPTIQIFARRYFESLFARLPRPFALILDNCQDVQSSMFHDVICQAIEAVPEGITVILISRESPPLSFSRLHANGRIETLGWEEIQFTQDEAAEFVRMKSVNGKIPEQTALSLYRRTGGWVTGLRIMLEHAKLNGFDPDACEKLTPELILRYFATEVFDKQDREMREFLLRTAFLPCMTQVLAEKLSGNVRAGGILAELTRNNYFTTRSHNRVAVYQYHRLFREFLLSKAEVLYGREWVTHLYAHAAALLEESGDFTTAVELYEKAGDWSASAFLICRQAPLLLAQGRSETVRSWIAPLPPGLVAASADLLFWHGASLATASPGESRKLFKRASALYRDQGDRAGLFLTWSAAVDVSILSSEIEAQKECLAVLRDILDEDPTFPTPEIEARVTMSIFNAMSFSMTDHPDIGHWHDRAYAIVLHDNFADINQRLMTGIHLMVYYCWGGNFARAAILDDFLSLMSRADSMSELIRLTIMTCKVIFYFLTARSEEGLRIHKEAMRLLEQNGIEVFTLQVQGFAIACALSAGDMVTADTYLALMARKLKELQSVDVGLYHANMAWLAMLRKEFPLALQHMRLATVKLAETGHLAAEGIAFAGMAEILWEVGEEEEAGRMLSKGYERAGKIGSSLLEFFCLLADARIVFCRGDEKAGLALLDRAMTMARKNGFTNKFWWRPEVMADLCARALEAGIETEYVRELVSKRELMACSPCIAFEKWPWPVKIYTLGRFDLLVNGEPVRFSGKVQKKPLEMLKALVALGGASREGEIADLLWPDAEGDSAGSSVKITLHRLRELLGNDKAVQVREGRLSLDRRLVWSDVWAFDYLLTEAQLMGDAGEETEAVRITEKALALYHGYFLGEKGEKSWAASPRWRLQSKFIQNVAALGNLWRTKGELKRAISCYLRGLEADDLAEEIYRNLISCYLAAELKGEAISAFLRCRKTLALHGVAPSAKTVAIYKAALE